MGTVLGVNTYDLSLVALPVMDKCPLDASYTFFFVKLVVMAPDNAMETKFVRYVFLTWWQKPLYTNL